MSTAICKRPRRDMAPPAKRDGESDKKRTLGARYKTFLAENPVMGGAMQQSTIVACANLTRQLLVRPAPLVRHDRHR